MTYITANELSSKLRLTCWLIIFQSKVPRLVQHVPLCQCWGVEAWGGESRGGEAGRGVPIKAAIGCKCLDMHCPKMLFGSLSMRSIITSTTSTFLQSSNLDKCRSEGHSSWACIFCGE